MLTAILILVIIIFLDVVIGFVTLAHSQEKLMSQSQTGLQALLAFVSNFQTFSTQITSDMSSLTTAVNNAIALLQGNEDAQVQQAVTELQSAQSTLAAVDTAITSATGGLTTAEGGTAPQAK